MVTVILQPGLSLALLATPGRNHPKPGMPRPYVNKVCDDILVFGTVWIIPLMSDELAIEPFEEVANAKIKISAPSLH